MEQFEQISIFDMLYEDFKIKNKIRIIEFFAGYGSQNLALKYLGADYEHYKICEWATKSIQAYNDLHIRDYTDYSKDLTQEEVVNFLYNRGISFDYNLPMTLKQINSKGEKWQRNVYNNIIATSNLVNIQKTHAKDLEIVDTNKYTYLLTYSFPCQDLSNAGNKAGFEKGSGTRSGMLWEVERILKECDNLPQCLLMENVPMIHSQENVENFKLWIRELEKLGYTNYWEDLNAKDYGIPQNRNRTFMVSILGEYNYKFPPKKKLELILEDMLEDNVDEKYFLSDSLLKCFLSDGTGKYPRKERFLQNINRPNKDIGNAVTTLAGNRPTDNFVVEKNERLFETLNNNDFNENNIIDTYNKKIKSDGVSTTLTTRTDASNNTFVLVKEKRVNKLGNYSPSGHNATNVVDTNGIAPTVMENHGSVTAIPIKNATKQGYLLAEKGDGVDISSRMKYHRGTVQKGMAQTLKANGVDVGVVVKDEPILVGGIGEKKSNGGTQYYFQDRIYDANGVSTAVTTSVNPNYLTGLRIRKLTPKECFRLMGLRDEDIDKIAKNQSNASQYHLAGDSIVVNVLMAIFNQMLDQEKNNLSDYEQQIKEMGLTINCNFWDWKDHYHSRFRNHKGELFDIVDKEFESVVGNFVNIKEFTQEQLNILKEYNYLKRKEHIQWLKDNGSEDIVKKYNLEKEI